MKALQEEIDMLEQENVGKRDWTLMGEASSKKRPENSLLEEDLEFESAGKAKPIITEEVTAGLEELIRTRILENRFDDVVRKRNMEATPFLPSKLLELSDAKSSKSLAQLYEDDYAASRGEGEAESSLPAADAKLRKEHEEIEQVFDEVCAKLDALSNAHYTPKAVSRADDDPCSKGVLSHDSDNTRVLLCSLTSPRLRSRPFPTLRRLASRAPYPPPLLPEPCWLRKKFTRAMPMPAPCQASARSSHLPKRSACTIRCERRRRLAMSA